eukprot:CAMPEP_0114234780 /NCGR_PEP_ID=MMETSP0058-20121206/5891_1 /TAXON_ID=36894 /ORGANISM="Pyramimonas parkeae, CCMP726" /LENGTH=304 /DNA_ID=CAMNT_0001346481 /DNA_START=182 /DNA_END=1096 /DNA_ORIENTATION=-
MKKVDTGNSMSEHDMMRFAHVDRGVRFNRSRVRQAERSCKCKAENSCAGSVGKRDGGSDKRERLIAKASPEIEMSEVGNGETRNECMNLGYDVEVLRAGKIKFKKLQALAKRHGISAKAKNAQVMIDKLVAKWELACSGKTDDAEDGWWHEVGTAGNVREAESMEHFQELVREAESEDRVIVVDFYRPSCIACRTMHPKLLKTAKQFSASTLFVKVNTRTQTDLARKLGVDRVPYFHMFHGSVGHVASFTCNLLQIGKLRAALERYAGESCNLTCPYPPPDSWHWFRLGMRPGKATKPTITQRR